MNNEPVDYPPLQAGGIIENNEPVAWMNQKGNVIPDDVKEAEKVDDFVFKNYTIPLYTHQYERPHNTVLVPCNKLAEMQAELALLKAHPVKELTDEEIEDECRKAWSLHDQDQLNLTEVFKFARAILRKAQEK